MEKIQVINELYNSIYAALKANSDLKKYVTNIYDYLPKQVTIPYLKLSIISYSNLHMLSNFATKARFACDIYTYHIDGMFSIMKRINLILEGFGTILENNCAVISTMKFYIQQLILTFLSREVTMSKLQLKIKDHNNNFVVLNNIRNLRFTLRNNREEIRDISSFGWRKVLDCAGSRHITIKINGILDSVLADELLRNSAMLNSNNDYEISFNAKEKIRLRCSVELYERYYDPAAFDSFTVVLASAEVVTTFH